VFSVDVQLSFVYSTNRSIKLKHNTHARSRTPLRRTKDKGPKGKEKRRKRKMKMKGGRGIRKKREIGIVEIQDGEKRRSRQPEYGGRICDHPRDQPGQ
jgi:hypothetical protein